MDDYTAAPVQLDLAELRRRAELFQRTGLRATCDPAIMLALLDTLAAVSRKYADCVAVLDGTDANIEALCAVLMGLRDSYWETATAILAAQRKAAGL